MLGYLLSTITIIHRKRYTWTRTQDPPATASQVAQDFRRHRREKGCPIFRVLLRKVGTTDACSSVWAVLRSPSRCMESVGAVGVLRRAENTLLWMTILMDANFWCVADGVGSPSGQK
jgi:hypothetical protein